MTSEIDKSFVGKYVCYATPDGSFTWGMIKDQGWQKTMYGEKEVFILTDQITCRVAKNELEFQTIRRMGTMIAEGKAGPTLLPGPTDQSTLPDYQKFGDRKFIEAGKAENLALVPVNTPEQAGLVPVLEKEMGLAKSNGLPMMQKVGMVVSSVDGREINFLLRRFGYDTSVRRDSLNMQTDIVDPTNEAFQGLTDGEMFLKVMQTKMSNLPTGSMFGQKAIGG